MSDSLETHPSVDTGLFAAAREGDLATVDLLLARGVDPNAREEGDNTYAMHWAAAAGELEVVRRLADAGGDVVGEGDDHQLQVIGWATCWDGCDDERHRAVVDFLLSRGARHHIFSAIAMNLADEVRRLVAENPAALNQRMSRNEDHELPLQFAARKNRREMVDLLLELGADPLGVDGSGFPVAAYVTSPDVDGNVMKAVSAMTRSELTSATRGRRPPNIRMIDLLAAISLGDLELAETLWNAAPDTTEFSGTLHLMSKRGDSSGVQWLLGKGMNPDSLWSHWDALVTPLHLAALVGHVEIARILLDNGADPDVRDSKHDSTAIEWAEFCGSPQVVDVLSKRTSD